MKRTVIYVFTIVGLIVSTSTYAQDSLSLSYFLKNMQQFNELYRVSPATDSVYALRKANIKTSYLPKLDFNAEASWQSEVTSINVPIPNVSIPSPDKDNYKITVDVSQLIWDGGTTNAKLQADEDARLMDQNKVDNEIYGLKDKVIALYFGLNSIDIAVEQLHLMERELDSRINELTAGVNAGAVLESSLISIQAEKLRLEQSIDANLAQRELTIETLKAITGIDVPKDAKFKLPQLSIPSEMQCVRPDYKQFDLQQNYLSATSKLTERKRYPILSAYARAGYGKPGLNMLSNEFNPYALFGARLTWNIWDWNSTSRDRQNLRIQQNMMGYRKDVFTENYNAQVRSSEAQIASLQKQIQSDEQIVTLLEKSVAVSASQLKNGTITSASYLSDFNSLLRAKIDMNLRTVKLAQEIVKLYYTIGLDIND